MKILDTEVARIGMGCWAIGGPFYNGERGLGYGVVDDDTSTRAIHAALDAGIGLFDTANVYGAGHSERVVGQALIGRNDVLVASKMGMGFDPVSKQVLADEDRPEQVMPAIEASLKRLRRSHIDILLLHLNTLDVARARPLFEAMELAREQGKIRAYGWSTDFPDSVAAMAGLPGFVAVEHAANVLADVPKMTGLVARFGLAGLIRSPLAMGALTGKFDASTRLPADDVRISKEADDDYFNGGVVQPRFLQQIADVRDLLQTGGRTLGQGALCWLLARSPNHLPIPGAKTAAQVVENAGALDFGPLPLAVMAEIEAVLKRPDEGPARKR